MSAGGSVDVPGSGPDEPGTDGTDEAVDARTVERLRAENRRLRREYALARRRRYGRTALGLAAVGAVATLGGLVLPDARPVLLVLGATGLFGGVLTYYVTPERFLPASVGAAVYRARAADGDAMDAELGLSGDRVYVPRSDDVRLFCPQHDAYRLPDEGALDSAFVVTDDPAERGLCLTPTGLALFREVRESLSTPLSDRPADLADQVAEGLAEGVELVDRAVPDVDPDGGRVSVGVAGSALGPVDRFDHPVASTLAVGFAVGLDAPVTVEGAAAEDDRFDYRLTVAWDRDPAAD